MLNLSCCAVGMENCKRRHAGDRELPDCCYFAGIETLIFAEADEIAMESGWLVAVPPDCACRAGVCRTMPSHMQPKKNPDQLSTVFTWSWLRCWNSALLKLQRGKHIRNRILNNPAAEASHHARGADQPMPALCQKQSQPRPFFVICFASENGHR